MTKNQGAEFLGEVHPVGAHNKTLISDTVEKKRNFFSLEKGTIYPLKSVL